MYVTISSLDHVQTTWACTPCLALTLQIANLQFIKPAIQVDSLRYTRTYISELATLRVAVCTQWQQSRQTRSTHTHLRTYTHLCLPISPGMSHYNYWQSIIIHCWRFQHRDAPLPGGFRCEDWPSIIDYLLKTSSGQRYFVYMVYNISRYVLCTMYSYQLHLLEYAEYGSPGPDPTPPMGHLLHNWLLPIDKVIFPIVVAYNTHIYACIHTIYIANISNIWE